MLTPSAIASLLQASGNPYYAAFGGALQVLTFDLGSFCTVDPPAVPTFTIADIAALVSVNDFDAFLTAQGKLKDLVGAYAWYQMCECTSVATPAPPTPTAPPTGAPSVNPPGVGTPYPSGQPCAAYTMGDTAPPQNSTTTIGPYPLNGATLCTMQWTADVATTTSGAAQGGIVWMNAAGGTVGSAGVGVGTGGTTATASSTAPATATQYKFTFGPIGTPSPTVTYQIDAQIYCGTTPGGGTGGPVPQPCPTDPYTTLLLNQILQLVTLIQRQEVPFAYIAGPLHSGLTGTGNVAVSGILGVLANCSVPSSTGEIAGTPTVRIPIGRLNLATNDGYTDRLELVTDSQVFFPRTAGLYTSIGYSLEPGVTLALTELIREP